VTDSVVDTKKGALPIIKCTYDGKTYALQKNKTVSLSLPDYIMPFQKTVASISMIRTPT